jgi:hypothetical protein
MDRAPLGVLLVASLLGVGCSDLSTPASPSVLGLVATPPRPGPVVADTCAVTSPYPPARNEPFVAAGESDRVIYWGANSAGRWVAEIAWDAGHAVAVRVEGERAGAARPITPLVGSEGPTSRRVCWEGEAGLSYSVFVTVTSGPGTVVHVLTYRP